MQERLALQRGLLQVIRTDNGKEFCGKALGAWAHESVAALRLIESGKPGQDATRILQWTTARGVPQRALVPNDTRCRTSIERGEVG